MQPTRSGIDSARLGLLPLAIGMAVVAFNLRPSITSVGPLLPRMQDELLLSTTGAAVLTALPIVCFTIVSPIAPTLIRRYRIEHAIVVSLIVLGAGLLLRIGPGVPALLFGTIVAGAATAVVNVLLPVLVKRYAPEQVGLVTGLYVMTMTFGAALGAGLTVPFADAVGGGWRAGLALWVVPVVPAALYWATRPRRTTSEIDPPSSSFAWKRVDWPVTLFFGLQSGVFYAAVGWLPTVLNDQGLTTAHSGALMSVALLLGIPTGLLAPIIAMRRTDQRLDVAVFVLLATVGLIGLFAVPSTPFLWMALFGLGIGGTFPLGLMLIVNRSSTPRETEQLSSVAQTLGYALAIAGPIAVGELHNLTGSWTPSLVMLAVVMLVPTMLSGLAAAGVRGRAVSRSRYRRLRAR